ncbi:hypothetical protein DB32_000969 [Sandaracinus amylolyticus]|uniref:Uncharacterized protein n=1 Tax=Sandaracinus amylolyticus TaxID=927083 RepID=A0A0F6YFL2_9BACT|nr:hypothetical protein DB32_000969 [Sandaracinus amylolyticus]
MPKPSPGGNARRRGGAGATARGASDAAAVPARPLAELPTPRRSRRDRPSARPTPRRCRRDRSRSFRRRGGAGATACGASDARRVPPPGA